MAYRLVLSKNGLNDEVSAVPEGYQNKQKQTVITLDDGPDTSASNDELINIQSSDLIKIFKQNSSLRTENKALKEELRRSVEFQIETKKNFAVVQMQLDKIIHLLENKNEASSSIIASDDLTSEDSNDKIISLCNLKFPIETKEEIDALESRLIEDDVMTYLVQKFSETCGTSGLARISKVGLTIMKHFIKDELLHQFSWKGIKGSTKTGFVQYVKIRELFSKIAHLADKTCAFTDSDAFIQHSAIKHSGQRLKRHSLSSERMKVKRSKKQINIIKKDTEMNHGSETNKGSTHDDISLNVVWLDEGNTDSEEHIGWKKEADD